MAIVVSLTVLSSVGLGCFFSYKKFWPKLSDYAIDDEIFGEGSFGPVDLATEKSSGEKVSIKFISKEKLDHSSIAQKLELLSKVSHKHIAKTKFLVPVMKLTEDHLPVVTEFAGNGTLETFAKSGIILYLI
jgi:serine/threonine protein kinase